MSWAAFELDVATLRPAWRSARPFPHVVVDGLLSDKALSAMRFAVAAEPHWPNRTEIYEVMGSAEEVNHPVLRRFGAALNSEKTRAAIECRSYVYLAGSYLLPHTDRDPAHRRKIAWVFYLSERSACEGGVLELMGDDPAHIEPVANRLVLFEVSDDSLHRVHEVTDGARISLAGWFLG